jgi:hypothetical protein
MKSAPGRKATPRCSARSPHKLLCGLPREHSGEHQAFGIADRNGERRILERWKTRHASSPVLRADAKSHR